MVTAVCPCQVSTAGVLEVEKRRPVDVLANILEERSAAKLEQFFRSYGAAEAAAMCFMLATSPAASASPVRPCPESIYRLARNGISDTF